jgi:hypothetical protein
VTRGTEIRNYLIITGLTLLIWYWAAGETRDDREINDVRIEFTIGESWRIEPNRVFVTLTAVGPRRAVRLASENLNSLQLVLERPESPGPVTIDLADRIREHRAIREAGISVVSVNPGTVDLSIDQLITETAEVRVMLPDVTVVNDEIDVEPEEVDVTMPSMLRRDLGDELIVEVNVERAELTNLDPGIKLTRESNRLRVQGLSRSAAAVTFQPRKVSYSFELASQIRQLHRDAVRVHLAGPSEDTEYIVDFEPKTLPNVTIYARAELIEKIRNGDAVVYALVHLKSAEKEERIDHQRVGAFVARHDDGTLESVRAEVNGSDDPPIIQITITKREDGT